MSSRRKSTKSPLESLGVFNDVEVYKGGARMMIADAKSKTSKRQFVTMEVFAPEDREGYGKMLIKVQDPMSKVRSTVILDSVKVSSAKSASQDKSLTEALSQVESWMQNPEKKPDNSTISKVLGTLLVGTLTRNGFQVSFDIAHIERLNKRERIREKQEYEITKSSSKNHSKQTGPKSITLMPGRGLLPQEEFPEGYDDDDEDDAWNSFNASQQMKAQNKKLAGSFSKPIDVQVAQIAMENSRRTVEEQQMDLNRDNLIAKAFETSAWRAMQSVHLKKKQDHNSHKEYKQLIGQALESLDLSKRLEEKAKSDRVKHLRELARMKWYLFPFRDGGKWQKGAVIGPGPLPLRALALMKSSSGSAITSTGHPFNGTVSTKVTNNNALEVESEGKRIRSPCPPSIGGAQEAALTQKERLQKAFDVVRDLAKTQDEYYLDFEGAFVRFDRKGKGFISRKDFEFMMGGLFLSESDLDILWGHFDRDNKNFLDKDTLIWGFYNQRKLLKVVQKQDEVKAFRNSVLERISQQAARSRAGESVTVLVNIRGVRNLFPLGQKVSDVFCIVSCCRLITDQEQETILITDEKRSTDGKIVPQGSERVEVVWKNGTCRVQLSRGTMQDRRRERLLVEVRAKEQGSISDAHSVFIGEIFYPILDLEAATNHFEGPDVDETNPKSLYNANSPRAKWFDLKNGEHKGQIALSLELLSQNFDHEALNCLAENEQVEGESDKEEDEIFVDPETKEFKDQFECERLEARQILDDLLSMN